MKEKTAKLSSKKYSTFFFAGACVIFLVLAALLYFASGEENGAYYYEDEEDLALVSAYPADMGGVSQDQTIILEWTHPVSVSAADDAVIRPSVRGKWSVAGNKLIFTPQKLSPGTYYTVSIPKGTVMNGDGEILRDNVFFAFETENPSLRFPKSEAFSVAGRSFAFTDLDSVSIPVSYIGGKDGSVNVRVCKAENSDAFIDAFAKLFAYPSWAKLSIARFRAPEKNFHEILDTDLAVIRENGSARVDLGSLPEGQYLVKLMAADSLYEAAVTVSPVDAAVFFDRGSLGVWSHSNGSANSDAEVISEDKSYTCDENGFVSVPFRFEPRHINADPTCLALKVKNGGDELALFIPADEVAESYRTELFVNKPLIDVGETIRLSGSVCSAAGAPLDDTAEVAFRSSAGLIDRTKVKIENGTFTLEREDLSLADGDYRFVLQYNGRNLGAVSFRVGKSKHPLFLDVEVSEDHPLSGDSVRYTAVLTDRGGNPVTVGTVAKDGGEGIPVDEEGKAVFKEVVYADGENGAALQSAVFTADSPCGTAEKTVSSVVIGGSEDPIPPAEDEPETGIRDGEVLALAYDGDGLRAAGENDDVLARLVYQDGSYTVDSSENKGRFSVVDAIEVSGGDTIDLSAALTGAPCRVAAVSLCKGEIAPRLCGVDRRGEGLRDLCQGEIEETKVFFGTNQIDAVFSTLNRNGAYFVRLAAETMGGSVVTRYIPVTIDGGALRCADDWNVAAGKTWPLSFAVRSEEPLDYIVTVADQRLDGEGEGAVSVDVEGLEPGLYGGKIDLYNGDDLIASKKIKVTAYEKPIVFASAQTEKTERAFAAYQVKEESADAFSKLFDTLLLPGDQILQRMGCVLFCGTIGEGIGWDASYDRNDFRSLQEWDGGFARRKGGSSDLLLSVLVAEREEFECDRGSLLAYIKSRLSSAADEQTAALACWGLCCFDVDCSGVMETLRESDGLDDYALMYLTEAYCAAGDKKTASELYQKAYGRFVGDGSILKNKGEADQTRIMEISFLQDIAWKLQQKNDEQMIGFLMNCDIQAQTVRYLLMSALLRTVSEEDIAPLRGDAAPGYTPLYLSENSVGKTDTLPVTSESEGTLKTGDVVKMTVSWSGGKNSIYLVCAKNTKNASVLESYGLKSDRGHYELITDRNDATLAFRADGEGENVLPEIYVYDLTHGEIVGAVGGGWKVTK